MLDPVFPSYFSFFCECSFWSVNFLVHGEATSNGEVVGRRRNSHEKVIRGKCRDCVHPLPFTLVGNFK
jgi:hypothetical protein